MKENYINRIVTTPIRLLAVLLSALIMTSGLEAGFGGLVKAAAKNAAKKKVEQEVEKAVTKTITGVIFGEPEVTMTPAEKAAVRIEKLEALDLDID